MADSLQSLVKQGSQLFQESTEPGSTIGQKTQQAGLPLAPSTPQETAVIGGSPSQAKMAGTPAGLKGQAQQQKLAPSLQLATQLRQEQASPLITAQQQHANQVAQSLSGLGSSLAQNVPNLIQSAINATVSGVNVTQTIDPSKFPPNLSSQDTAALTTALTVLNDPNSSQSQKDGAMGQIATITGNSSITSDPTTAQAYVQSFYKDTKTTPDDFNAALTSATPASITLGMLGETPSALGYSSWDSLAQDLGIQPGKDGKSPQDQLKSMSITDLSKLVDTLKRTNYQTEAQWMSVLQDPTSSTQDREVARTMLRNMGATGIDAAEQKVANLSNQVAANTQVTVNLTGVPQTVSVDDIFKNDTLMGAVKVLLDPNDANFQAVSEANPGLLKWVQANQASLQDQVAGVSTEVSSFATINAANTNLLKPFAPDQATQDAIGKALFPTWGQPTGTQYDLQKAPLLQNWAQIPAAEQPLIQSALQTIADGGTQQDILAFLNSDRDSLRQLGLNTQAGMAAFQSYWAEQKLVRSYGTSTSLESPDSMLMDLTGMTQDQLKQASDTEAALKKYGFSSSTNFTLPDSLKDALSLAVPQEGLADLLKSGQLPTSLKDRLNNLRTEESSFTASAPDDVTKAIVSQVVKKGGDLDATDVSQIAANFSSDPAAIRELGLKTGLSKTLMGALMNAGKAKVDTQLSSVGLDYKSLDEALSAAQQDPTKAPDLLSKIGQLLKNADPASRQYINSVSAQISAAKQQYDQAQADAAAAADAAALAKLNKPIETPPNSVPIVPMPTSGPPQTEAQQATKMAMDTGVAPPQVEPGEKWVIGVGPDGKVAYTKLPSNTDMRMFTETNVSGIYKSKNAF